MKNRNSGALASNSGVKFKTTTLCTAVTLAWASGALLAGGEAFAQADSTQRVTVTGSSIKRTDSETALPLTVMTRAQIEQSGATSVEDLLKRVSAISGSVSETTQGAGYATANANLRGLGPNSTLVLLNGRRLANHPFGSIGGTAAVDLNSIPFAAIERIDVLRDGASAIYGADAVGGVINFVTRKNYKSGDVSVRYGDTQKHIGGKEKGGSIAIGFGDLGGDGYNFLFTANVQKNERLRAVEQKYYDRGVQEVPGSSPPSSSAPFPGFLAKSVAPGSYPELTGNNSFYTPCSGNAYVPTPSAKTPSGADRRGCRFIYAATLDNLPDQEKGDIFGRATFRLNDDFQLATEFSYSRNHSIGRIAPTPIKYGFGPYSTVLNDFKIPVMPVTSKYYPRDLLTKLGYVVPATGMDEVALRAIPAGNRINDNTNEQLRGVVSLTGTVAGWDIDTGLNIAQASGKLNYKGYINEDRILAALASGNLNPFGPGDATHDALWKSSAMEGDMRQSKSTTTEFDLKGSRELMALAGGNLGVALGVNVRNEKADDKPLNAEYAEGKHIGGEGTVPYTSASRTLTAAFGEVSLPFAKGWEATVAGRFDHYSDFGNNFSPRVSLRWQPDRSLVFRGSAGSGFRAPTLWDVNSPVSWTNTADSVRDPACPSPGNSLCDTQISVRQTATPGLKPETSKQFSLGMVWEPIKNVSVTVDYWNISKKDNIGVLAANTLLESPDLLKRFGSRVQRNAQGFIKYVETPVDNIGELKTSGFDLDVRSAINLGNAGRVNLAFSGTYTAKFDAQLFPGDKFNELAGTGGNSTYPPTPTWQHNASAEWNYQDFSVSLENVFVKGWTESAAQVNANIFVDTPHKVKDSSRFNLGFTYKGFKNLTAKIGVRNLLDQEPPFVASSSYGSHAAGYAASFVDPRGRFVYVTLGYKFK